MSSKFVSGNYDQNASFQPQISTNYEDSSWATPIGFGSFHPGKNLPQFSKKGWELNYLFGFVQK